MAEIHTRNGFVILLDDGDFRWARHYTWNAHKDHNTRYAEMGWAVGRHYRDRLNLRMHRLILGLPPGVLCDHINGNGLDNRRCNLRPCTMAQNFGNQRKVRGCTSRYKGVYWQRAARKWRAYIQANGLNRHLGMFEHEEDAALAYDAAAIATWGEFAKLNLPDRSLGRQPGAAAHLRGAAEAG